MLSNRKEKNPLNKVVPLDKKTKNKKETIKKICFLLRWIFLNKKIKGNKKIIKADSITILLS